MGSAGDDFVANSEPAVEVGCSLSLSGSTETRDGIHLWGAMYLT